MNHRKNTGMALLALVVLMLFGGLLASKILQNRTTLLETQRVATSADQRTLQILKKELLQYASLQGSNSLYDLGNMPCPSLKAGGIPQTTCHQNNWGFLPRQSKAAINHLRLAPPSQQLLGLGEATNGWQYAVSEQVIQPNSLGWSGKVDWTQPPLRIFLGDDLHEDAVAVISAQLKALPDGTLFASTPAVLIKRSELTQKLEQVALIGINATLNSIDPDLGSDLLLPFIEAGEPRADNCTCRCTKTRCECSCTRAAWWGSEGHCLSGYANCDEAPETLRPTQFLSSTQAAIRSVCLSDASYSCWFAGPAFMLGGWPVSDFTPTAATGRSCNPDNKTTCPVSSKGTACYCEFGWPKSSIPALDHLAIKKSATGWEAQWKER